MLAVFALALPGPASGGTLSASGNAMLSRLATAVQSCNAGAHTAQAALPFVVGDRAIGLVLPKVADQLRRFGDVYSVSESSVRLLAGGDSVAARSQAIMATLETMRDDESVPMLRGWRSETWPMKRSFFDAPEVLIERAAVPMFGCAAYGCFVNGLVAGDRIWIARRSRTKQTYPGLLDLLAAGGLAHGEKPRDNVLKECQEEASIPRELAALARPAGYVAYTSVDESGWGIKRDTLFVYDLVLPETFVPVPSDGEVESFELMQICDVIRSLADRPEIWKPNVRIVLCDMFVRLGHLTPDQDGYLELVSNLRMHGGR
ncbi:NUDIX hydrolase domain-like protein [Pavlovales sp. CCMP2436]|nr:NUDIX hydrolase domain-like protein [Pavlovales sp. CCMP2436]